MFERIIAQEGVTVPEVPNFITLLYSANHGQSWITFLHHWEAIFFSLFAAILIALFFYLSSKKPQLIPSGAQNFVEFIVESVRDMAVSIIGPTGVKYVPLLGTLFVYIFVMNMMGKVPFLKSPSSNINVTVGLALVVFCFVQYLNIKHMGFFGFIHHMAGSPKSLMQWLLVPLMLPLEIITQLSRPITLAFRLFGNVLGEDILIGAFAVFGLSLLADFNSPVGFPLQIPFMFLGILTGTMQALVFTLLSTVYILLSMPEH